MFTAGNWKKARFTAVIGESFFSDVLALLEVWDNQNKGNCVVEDYNGLIVQPHKAIVGARAFDYETGIHQELNDLF
ncbi:unnamed protein product [Lactuca saligna]|uniref:Uncharacterized protein n=1 Tax=Lactuca saligna TaxID=75948 RepID=A0AA35Y7F9_LACSI|nr:unnamed protein product [Lactuca saligna]